MIIVQFPAATAELPYEWKNSENAVRKEQSPSTLFQHVKQTGHETYLKIPVIGAEESLATIMARQALEMEK